MKRKRRHLAVEYLEDRRLLAGDITQLRHFDTWDGGIIRSTDVAGLTSHPSGHLYLVDSEINELSSIFNGNNVFETSLSGDQAYRGITSGNEEPTGITYNEFDGYFYVTSDTGERLITRYDSNLNNPLHERAADDALDPEGITSDPVTGSLYVVDGHGGDRKVLVYGLDLSDPNESTRDLIFQGAFSVADRMNDPEGIAFHEPSGHLFLIDSSLKKIFEYTKIGLFVDEYDIDGFSPEPVTPQGLTFGPTSSSSDDPTALSLYIADGGGDNKPDGHVYEAAIVSAMDANHLVDIRVLADVPYSVSEYSDLETDLANVGPTDEFFVHLGDIQAQGDCQALTYSDVANSLKKAPLPVFIVPGDNEYNDCPDPVQAWTYWEANLLGLEQAWSHPFHVMRQAIRQENFAFIRTGVLFIGINLVGGDVHDSNEWSQRMSDNAVWINENFDAFGDQVKNAVVFGHAFPDPEGGDTQQFGKDFVAAAENFGKPILYAMGNHHEWELDNPYDDARNVTRVTVDQGVPSVRVSISDHPVSPFNFSSSDLTPPPDGTPVLAAIGSQSVGQGSLLSFTAGANDRKIPFGNLLFSLDAGGPDGATIDPTTGLFRWTPSGGLPVGDYAVTVRVTDGAFPALQDFETITITVNHANQPPVLAEIGSQTVMEGSLLTFTASATDPDQSPNDLSFSLDPGAPTGATIDSNTGVFSWIPGEADGPGVHSVSVRVTDGGDPNRDDFEVIEITVGEVNQAPVLSSLGKQTVDEGSTLTFLAVVDDPDLPANKLRYSLDAGAPIDATIDPNTGIFSWTPAPGFVPGDYTATIRVADEGGLEDSQTITITVKNVNLAPKLGAIGGKEVAEGSLLTFTATATDIDLPSNNMSFSLDPGAPESARIDPVTGVFSWTPEEADGPAAHSVTVRVTDDGTPNLDDFETFDIIVGELNQPPQLLMIGDQIIDEASLLTFTAAVIDPDLPANDMFFSLDAGAPAGAVIDPSTGQFRWTPAGGTSPGTYSITIRVNDRGQPSLEDSQTFTITVNDVNLQPMLAVVGAQRVQEGNLFTFTASATDLDLPANNLSFSLDETAPPGAIINPVTGDFRWTPGESAGPGIYPVTVRVTDDGVPIQEDFQTFNITVDEVNQPPVLASISDRSIDEGKLLVLRTSATDLDLPANTLTYSLDPGAPVGATIHPVTGQFRWTPDEAHGPGVYSISVRVTDDAEESLDDVQTFEITVGEVNQAPKLLPIGDRSVDESSLLAFTVAAADADLPVNQMTFSLDDGAPFGASIDADTGEFRWTPNESHGPGVYSVTVRISDNATPNLDDFETIDIVVSEVNQPPVLAPIGERSVDEGNQLIVVASAIDPDTPANNLSFSLDSGAPLGASIDSTTGVFRWTPTEADGPGVYAVTLRVTDDGAPRLDDFETFEIIVGEINRSPVIAPIDSQSVNEGSLLTFTVLAYDQDTPANNLTFHLGPGAPKGASIDPRTGQFSWTPMGVTSSGTHTVIVRVRDDGVPNLEDSEAFTIMVKDINLPPVLAPIGNQTVDERSVLRFTARATDHDFPADRLTYSLDSGAPAGAAIHPTTGEFTWNLGELDGPVTHTVTVRVTDDGLPQQVDFETFTITVSEVNQPPTLMPIGDKRIEEAGLLTFTALAVDENLPVNNLSFSLDSGAPDGAMIDPTTGQFRWEPPAGSLVGDHVVTVRVTDDGEPKLDDFETIKITVDDINLPPVLGAIGRQSVREGSQLTFVASVTDLDLPANNLTFSLDPGAPSGAKIDAATGVFSWTPGESHGNGLFSVTVRVTDDGKPKLSDSETLKITVLEVNQTPVLRTIGDKRIKEGRLLAFTAFASDADVPTDDLTFSLDPGAPDGATIDPNTGQFRWMPEVGIVAGERAVTIRVRDDGVPNREDFETITITVEDENTPPVLSPIDDQRVDEGSLLTFMVVATDSDLPVDTLTYSLDADAPSGATIDPSTGEFRWTPHESHGSHVFNMTVRVTDSGAPSKGDVATFHVDVRDTNLPPVLASIGDMQVSKGNQLTLKASATDADMPANDLTFSLGFGAPDGATIDPTTGDFLWEPGASVDPGVYSVTVRVADDQTPSLIDSATIKITVTEPPPNDPLDVNGDGVVTVLDALAIINEISRIVDRSTVGQGSIQVVNQYDTNGDGNVSVVDALRVINHIAAQSSLSETESLTRAPSSPMDDEIDDDLICILADDIYQIGRELKIR